MSPKVALLRPTAMTHEGLLTGANRTSRGCRRMTGFDGGGRRPLPATRCHRVIVAIESRQGALDMQISTIGLDIAKNVFQVHGIDAAEKVVVRKRLRRR